MNMASKKGTAFLLAAATLAGVLAGCTSTPAPNTSADGSQPSENTPEPITLTLWANNDWETNEVTKQAMKDLEAEGIILEVETFQDPSTSKTLYVNAMEAGEGPDIGFMNLWWVEDFAKNGYLLPLEDLISDETMQDMLEPFRTDSVVYDGHMYATWINTDCGIVIYNKELFDAAGIQAPALDEAWTVDEFRENAKKLTNGNTWGVGINCKNEGPTTYSQFPFFWMYGGELFDENRWPCFNSQAAVDSFQLYYDLIYTDKVMPAECTSYGYDDIVQGFIAGQYAMMLGQPSHVKTIEETEGMEDKVGVMLYPVPDSSVKSTTIHGGWTLGIFSDDPEKQEAALKVIEYLQTPEHNAAYAKSFGSLPVMASAYDADPTFQTDEYKTYREQLKSANYKPGDPIFMQLMDEYTVAMIEYLMNEKSAQVALDEAYERVVEYGLSQHLLDETNRPQ